MKLIAGFKQPGRCKNKFQKSTNYEKLSQL